MQGRNYMALKVKYAFEEHLHLLKTTKKLPRTRVNDPFRMMTISLTDMIIYKTA